MRKTINMLSWICGVAAMLAAGVSFAAEGNASNGSTIFNNGKGDAVQACKGCHGEKGQGNDDMGAPRLSGQGITYIVKQLTDFANDKRTPAGLGAVMPGFAKALSEQERHDVAAYVNSLKFDSSDLSDLKKLAAAGKVGETYKGQEIVKFGQKDKVSSCYSCHGYNGRGAAPVFPMIGQQKYVYLVNQLRNWRASPADITAGAAARTNDPVVGSVGIMREVAKKLTDDDILNVAAFLSSAPATTGGNSRVPSQD